LLLFISIIFIYYLYPSDSIITIWLLLFISGIDNVLKAQLGRRRVKSAIEAAFKINDSTSNRRRTVSSEVHLPARCILPNLLTHVELVAAYCSRKASSLRRSTKHREHPRRHFRFCYVRMQRAPTCAHKHTYTHTDEDRGASSWTLNHVRLSLPLASARALTYSIRFFTRSDWLLLHGAVRQSNRVVDKLTRYMLTTPAVIHTLDFIVSLILARVFLNSPFHPDVDSK